MKIYIPELDNSYENGLYFFFSFFFFFLTDTRVYLYAHIKSVLSYFKGKIKITVAVVKYDRTRHFANMITKRVTERPSQSERRKTTKEGRRRQAERAVSQSP